MRFFLSSLCIGTLCAIVLGCSVDTKVEPKESDYEMDNHSKDHVYSSSAKEDLSIEFSRVSLISQEGIEVELDAIMFQEQWDEYTKFLKESDPFALNEIYTVVGWDKLNQPYVFQVSAQGLKVGQDYYKGEKIEQLVQWIKEHIGIEYLNNLTMEGMILEARDLEIKKELPRNLAKDVFHLITSSTLVKGEARIKTPLYPFYLMDVEYKKDQFLQLVVLSPTLISIEDGNDRWFYQLNGSVFSLLKDVIPITHFSDHHIKHLFQAQEIVIQHKDTELNLSEQVHEELILETVIHEISRLFAQGKRTGKMNQGSTEPLFIVQFNLPDSSVSQIEVYDHYYDFHNQIFDLYDVNNKLQEIIQIIDKQDKQ